MQNKTTKLEKTISLSNLPSIIIAVVLVIGIGTVFGLLGHLVSEYKKSMTFIDKGPTITITDNYFGNEFIQIKSPQKNATIKNPILISGKANVYEANVRVRISDNNKNILADDFITAGGWMDKLYLFEKEIDYKTPQTENGLIEIFEESVKDGSEIYKVEVPVVFGEYKDAFSDWEVYRNEEFEFEVKYPSNFILRERINEDHASFIVGFIKSIHAHANTVGIHKYNSEEEVEKFKHLPYVRLYERDGYYLAVWGTSNELSDQILSTFKFIEEDETVDWKTYRNEKYGFEMKYPEMWIAFEKTPTYINIHTNQPGGILIEIYPTDSNNTLDNIKNDVKKRDGIYDLREIFVSGIKGIAYGYVGAPKQSSGGIAYVFEKNKSIIRMNFDRYEDYETNYTKTRNQILSSFKFIEE